MVAVLALVNVGFRLTVAPCKGFVEEAVMEAVAADTTLTTVLTDLLGSSCEVAVMVTLPGVSGAVH